MNEKWLSGNVYPGRGIIIGLTPDEKNFVQVYWIMGRSENSRNRVFVREGDSVKTRAHIESKMTDPSLVIYYPIRVAASSAAGNVHIVTNGDQTDTIHEHLSSGKTFEEALLARQYEPDPPNFTPRISGALHFAGRSSTCSLSVLSTVGNNESIEKKEFYTLTSFIPGEGFCIHTYMGDGNPLPSFDISPYAVGLENSMEDTAKKYWSMLDRDNRVSLLVKHIDTGTGKSDITIINRHE